LSFRSRALARGLESVLRSTGVMDSGLASFTRAPE
jgi:hypothetical protein